MILIIPQIFRGLVTAHKDNCIVQLTQIKCKSFFENTKNLYAKEQFCEKIKSRLIIFSQAARRCPFRDNFGLVVSPLSEPT